MDVHTNTGSGKDHRIFKMNLWLKAACRNLTPYPPDLKMILHAKGSHSLVFKLQFFCMNSSISLECHSSHKHSFKRSGATLTFAKGWFIDQEPVGNKQVWQLAGLDLLVPGAVKKAAWNVMSCSCALWVLEFALGPWCSSVNSYL